MKLRHLPTLRRHFGTRWLAQRALYTLKLRSGALRRRLPARNWAPQLADELIQRPDLRSPEQFYRERTGAGSAFFFSPKDRSRYAPLFSAWDGGSETPVAIADSVANGQFRFFEHQLIDCGSLPDWHRNHLTGTEWPRAAHWSEIGDFARGDVKIVWEPSRFGFAYALVRAYWRTGDERYPAMFWQLVEDWQLNNQPQLGANWKCGQEATFRAMAWCFALYGFLEADATTPERVFQLGLMLGTTALRIEANIDYALGQANNHGISEGVGLWTIGLLFPELVGAARWQNRGRDILEREGEKLIYPDGAFAQHSVNYHRLMLHDYLWALRLGDLHGKSLSEQLKERVGRAGEFLFQIQDAVSGSVPYYGQNDGALILPLNNCSYHDFRPVVAAVHLLSHHTRAFDDGPWAEDLLWLFGPDSLTARVQPRERTDLRADEGGYYTLRSATGFVFTRCPTFRHRPSQADLLHVDLWWRGHNIAVDAGTFSYNSSEPWSDAFAGTLVHNTVSVDGQDQMRRAAKFLWLPWVEATVRSVKRKGVLACFEGEIEKYSDLKPPVAHRRGIAQLDDETWIVIDHAHSAVARSYRLHWLLADLPHHFDADAGKLSLHTVDGNYHVTVGPSRASLVRADPEGARGWRAPYYNYREPALSLIVEQAGYAATFWSVFSPQPARVTADQKRLEVETGGKHFHIAFGQQPHERLIKAISTESDQLQVES